MGPEDLPEQVLDAMQRACAEGDALAASGKFEDAIAAYNGAWEMVPEPKAKWNASTWVLAAIGDAAFLSGYGTTAREALEYALVCPGGLGNPFVHLRLGQTLFDKGEHDRAADELMRAYMGGGKELFATEDDRYLSFLRTRAKLD